MLESDERGHGVGGAGAQAALQRQLLVDVDVNFGLEMEHFEAALDHPPCGIAGIGGHAWMGAAERNAGRWGDPRLHRHPLMEGEGLVHGGELVEPIRTQRTDCQAQIDLGMGANAGGHRCDSSLHGMGEPEGGSCG